MTYILVIWTIVGVVSVNHHKYDWRPIGEFQNDASHNRCEAAARELGLDPKNYRCVRAK